MECKLDCERERAMKSMTENDNKEDPFLTAARMLRGGGWQKTWEMSDQSSSSERSTENTSGNPVSYEQKEPKDQQQAVNNKMTPKFDKADQVNGNILCIENKTGSVNVTSCVVRVWTSGCRPNSRKFRRFKAPLLPAIAEK
ncbi:hypothetical protein NL108_008324 [Boleophthalmus pectinirostris]|nr:hypothetical protein NL108_008324 [Boleophthalmus pectinirostris]